MKLKRYYNLLTKKTSAEKPASITWNNIKAVIQSFVRKKQLTIDGMGLPQHIFEQIIWRRVQVKAKSPMCWLSGECIICGCDILGKTMEDRACSVSEHNDLKKKREPCYPAMVNSKEWALYKLQLNIKLFQ